MQATRPEHLGFDSLALLLLLDLQQECTVDMWQDTSERDRRTDEGIEFFVSADGELQVARGNTLDFEILGSVSCKLQNFSGKVFKNGCDIDGGLGSNTHLVLGVVLQETLNTTAGELKTSLAGVALLLLASIDANLAPGRLSAR